MENFNIDEQELYFDILLLCKKKYLSEQHKEKLMIIFEKNVYNMNEEKPMFISMAKFYGNNDMLQLLEKTH